MRLELSDKEMNYIESALRKQIEQYARGPLAGLGNVPDLLRFTKQTYRRLRILRGWPKSRRVRYLAPLPKQKAAVARRKGSRA
jgi:hypothetical protein